MQNVSDWNPILCWRHYRDREHWADLLRSTWVRPEDLHHYDELVDGVKLATRMHRNPRMVIHAYSQGRHGGNLADLLEPGFGSAMAPDLIDNTRFPAEWFTRTSTCGRTCESCRYCADVLEDVLVRGA